MNFLLHNSTKGNFCCTTLRKEISVAQLYERKFLLHNYTKGNFCCTTLRKEISAAQLCERKFLLHNSTKGNFCCTTLRKEISVDLKVIFCGTLSLSYANIHLIKTRCFTLMSTLRSLHVKNGFITLSHFPFPGVKISR